MPDVKDKPLKRYFVKTLAHIDRSIQLDIAVGKVKLKSLVTSLKGEGYQPVIGRVVDLCQEPITKSFVYSLPDIRHCYSDYPLRDAVKMVLRISKSNHIKLQNMLELEKFYSTNGDFSNANRNRGKHAFELIFAFNRDIPISHCARR